MNLILKIIILFPDQPKCCRNILRLHQIDIFLIASGASEEILNVVVKLSDYRNGLWEMKAMNKRKKQFIISIEVVVNACVKIVTHFKVFVNKDPKI